MRNSIVGFIASLTLLSLPFVSMADVATSTPSNGDPKAVSQVWGLTGYNTPIVSAGTVVTDAYGVSDTCPKWYAGGCSDLTRTDWYSNQMKDLARKLIASGRAELFPMFAGWVRLVR